MVQRKVHTMIIENTIDFIENLYKINEKLCLERKKLNLPTHNCSGIHFSAYRNDYPYWEIFEKIKESAINFSLDCIVNRLFTTNNFYFYFFTGDCNFFKENRISSYFKIYKRLKKNFPNLISKIKNYDLLKEQTYRIDNSDKIRYYSLEKFDKQNLKEYISICDNNLSSSLILISKNNYLNDEDKLRFFKSAFPIDTKTQFPCEDEIKISSIIYDYCLKGDFILTPSISHVDEMAFSMQLFMSQENFVNYKKLL